MTLEEQLHLAIDEKLQAIEEVALELRALARSSDYLFEDIRHLVAQERLRDDS